MTDRELRELADLIAERVTERLAAQLGPVASPAGGLVDAATVAAALGVSRRTVYARASELGAMRVGAGPRARLRFDLERARAALERDPESEPARATPRRRKPRPATVPLLPIAGRDA